MIVYQENFQVEQQSMIQSLSLINSWVYIIILLNLYIIVLSIINLNLLNKDIKDDYNFYYLLSRAIIP